MIVTDFPVESRKPTPAILSTQKIESRIEIAVLISKYEVTVENKSLIEMNRESA